MARQHSQQVCCDLACVLRVCVDSPRAFCVCCGMRVGGFLAKVVEAG